MILFCAVQDALAKLAAAKSALEAEQQLTAKRGSQVNELASQVESLKATLGTVSQRAADGPAMSSLTAQLSDRDEKIAVSRLHGFCGLFPPLLVGLPVCCLVTGCLAATQHGPPHSCARRRSRVYQHLTATAPCRDAFRDAPLCSSATSTVESTPKTRGAIPR
jgi:hypothetical protein